MPSRTKKGIDNNEATKKNAGKRIGRMFMLEKLFETLPDDEEEKRRKEARKEA